MECYNEDNHSTITSAEAVVNVKKFLSDWNSTRSDFVLREVSSVYAWRSNEICFDGNITRSSVGSALPDTLLYIVNFDKEEGFALVSADSYDPGVVAFVENGSLMPGQSLENPGLQLFLEGYKKLRAYPPLPEIDTTQLKPFRPRPQIPETEENLMWKFDCHILPMLTTNWHQRAPYNDSCFTSSGIKAPAGCTSVALAQIVAYHRHPSSFGGHSYKWDSILQTDNVSYNNLEACKSVAQLMHDIGEQVNITYNEKSSGVYHYKIPNLWNNFGYHHINNSSACSFDSIKTNLSDNNPVYISCSGYLGDEYVGHSWVIDGLAIRSLYDLNVSTNDNTTFPYFPYAKIKSVNLVHCNWGWGGLYNGYFLYDALNKQFDLTSNTTSDFIIDFDNRVRMYTQIYPSVD